MCQPTARPLIGLPTRWVSNFGHPLRQPYSSGCLQIRKKYFYPIKRELIAQKAGNPAIPLNGLVDLDALIAHGTLRQADATKATCSKGKTTVSFWFL
jgi:hypothetical protein